VVGDLEKAFTPQDKTDAAGKTVELKFTAEAKAADSTNDAQQEIVKKAGSIDLFLDFTLTKTVDGTPPSSLDSSPVLLTAVITLPAELQGKDSYTVYRYHGTEVQILTTTANKGGEKIEVSKDKTTLTVYTKNFSPYAIQGITYSGGGGVSSYILTFEVNGGSAITALSKTSGATVDLSAYSPVREGYSFAGWYSDAKLTKAITSVKLTANTTIYAKWTEKGAMPFTDVPADSYYYDAVLWALDKGITGGTTATTFNPNGICTRAQAVTFLWRAMGSPEPSATSCPFTDVAKNVYYYKAVLWATEKGITVGTSNTTFSPDATVTRCQTVTFLWRTADKPTVNSANLFGDVESDAYYANAVLWAVSEGITSGTGASIFSPADGCTRAQIVTFLYRYLSK
jgi:Listeria/Bacterioides repeat